METKQYLLAAKTYVMLAKTLHENRIDCRHYLLYARICINKYYLLKQNEATLRLVA